MATTGDNEKNNKAEKNEGNKNSEVSEIVTAVVSGAELQEHSFLWKIENFGMVEKSSKWINSQIVDFEAGTRNSKMLSKWRVYLATCTEATKEWIGIYYRLLEGPTFKGLADVQVECDFTVQGGGTDDGPTTEKHCQTCRNYYISCKSNVYCPNCSPLKPHPNGLVKYAGLASVSDLTNGIGFRDVIDRKSIGSFIDKDGYLNIKCNLKLFLVSFGPAKPFTAKVSLEEFHKKSISKANSDLEGLLSNKVPCTDVKILAVDKKEFTAQWGMLCRRSSYFANMYETNLDEVKNGVIILPDISGKTLEVLLRFLYTGILLPAWKDDDVIVELTNAAAKYGLLELEEFFDGILGSVCNLQTALHLLSLAQKLCLKTAEKDLLQWIKENSLYSAECFFKLWEPMDAIAISDSNSYGEMKGLDQKQLQNKANFQNCNKVNSKTNDD